MKYIEYIYLAAAAALLVMLVQGYEEFSNTQRIATVVAIGVTSFMFSFRRKQRVVLEQKEKAEFDKLEKEVEDESNA